MDLAEFLTARYDEIENALTHLPKRARELPWELYQQGFSAQGGSRGRSVPWAVRVARDEHAWTVADRLDRSIAEYLMAVGDPARVLADITAKRRILEDYQIVAANNAIEKATDGDEVEIAARELIVKSLRMVLLRLAAPYADHPDYDEAWKIEVDGG